MIIAGLGGFLGTCGRFAVNKCCALFWSLPFPLSTFIVNIVGCFLFGLFGGIFEKSNILTPAQSLLLITGFCGGFTTFSTFAGEVFSLGAKGEWSVSALYLLLSILAGVVMVWLGRLTVKSLMAG